MNEFLSCSINSKRTSGEIARLFFKAFLDICLKLQSRKSTKGISINLSQITVSRRLHFYENNYNCHWISYAKWSEQGEIFDFEILETAFIYDASSVYRICLADIWWLNLPWHFNFNPINISFLLSMKCYLNVALNHQNLHRTEIRQTRLESTCTLW